MGAACPCPRATLVGRERPARAGIPGGLCELVRKGRIGGYDAKKYDKLAVLDEIYLCHCPQPALRAPCPKAGTAELHRKHQPDKLEIYDYN